MASIHGSIFIKEPDRPWARVTHVEGHADGDLTAYVHFGTLSLVGEPDELRRWLGEALMALVDAMAESVPGFVAAYDEHITKAVERLATADENRVGVAAAKAAVDPVAVAMVGESVATAYAEGEAWARHVVDEPDEVHHAMYGTNRWAW